MKDVHRPLTAALRLIGLITWMLLVMPFFALFKRIGWHRTASTLLRLIYAGLVRASGFRIKVIGEPCRSAPVLYVANHCSYFDIPVLGSLLDAAFVAKMEVGTWPGIGFLARLAGTVFVERRARHSRTQRDEMKARLDGALIMRGMAIWNWRTISGLRLVSEGQRLRWFFTRRSAWRACPRARRWPIIASQPFDTASPWPIAAGPRKS